MLSYSKKYEYWGSSELESGDTENNTNELLSVFY